MGLKIIQVDAFTNKPFSGNPAAVCILAEPSNEQWMQHVAREMNLSETAFLCPQQDGFNLRWFTPAVEVPLCGHATLASAHVLWEERHLEAHKPARFYTHSGLLIAERKGNWIELDFPAIPDEPVAIPSDLAKALGVRPQYVGKSKLSYLLEVDSEEVVRNIKPDFDLLRKIPVRAVIVTSLSSSPAYDFVCRFFAPGSGIDEDPVTGSALCCLAPFWKHRLNKNELVAYQASSRGGVMRARMGEGRVYIGGQAVTVLRGELVDDF